MKRVNVSRYLTLAFLLIELVLYYLILTTSGDLLVVSSYSAIVLCFLFALINVKHYDPLILFGLGFTVAADYFLVVCTPVQQLWGMLCFVVTQTLYAVRLHKANPHKWILYLRIVMIALVEFAAYLILKGKLDTLVVVSVCYYANLVVNIIAAFSSFRCNKLFSVALVLFLLCDTVIGLQVASGAYLPLAEGSFLHKIIFMDFFLSWFFYLPSQVLIALSGYKKGILR